MRLTISAEDGRIVSLDVSKDETLQNVMGLIESELSIKALFQQLVHNGNVLADATRTLDSLSISDGDLLLVLRRGESSSADAGASSAGSSALASRAGGAGGRRRPMSSMSGAPAPKRATLEPAVYSALTWEDLPPGVTPETLHAILQARELLA